MSHPCTSESEHQVVGYEIVKNLPERSVVHVHLAFEKLKQVFSNLSIIFNYSWNDMLPEFHSTVIAKQKEVKSKTCDIITLHCLLDLLLEKSNQMDYILQNPGKWVDAVEQCGQMAERILKLHESHDYQLSEGIEDVRNLWTKINIKNIYVEYVIAPTEKDIQTGKHDLCNLHFYKKAVKDSPFEEVKEFLKDTLLEGFGLLDQDIGECPNDCEEMIEFLVILPCKHWICHGCSQQPDLKCPEEDCLKVVPKDYVYDHNTETQSDSNKYLEGILKFRSLRERLNRFFMNFITGVVCTDKEEVEDSVVESLLNDVLFSEFCEPITRGRNFFNSNMIVEYTPILRQFILNHLMRGLQKGLVIRLIDNWLKNGRIPTPETLAMIMSGLKETKVEDSTKLQLADNLLKQLPSTFKRIAATETRIPSTQSLMAIVEAKKDIADAVGLILSTDVDREKVTALLACCSEGFQQANQQPCYLAIRQMIAMKGIGYISDHCRTAEMTFIPKNLHNLLSNYKDPILLKYFLDPELYQKGRMELKELLFFSGTREQFDDRVVSWRKVCHSNKTMLSILYDEVTLQSSSQPNCGELSSCLRKTLRGSPKLDGMIELLTKPSTLPEELSLDTWKGRNTIMLALHLFSYLTQGQQSQMCEEFITYSTNYIIRRVKNTRDSGSHARDSPSDIMSLSDATLQCITTISLYTRTLLDEGKVCEMLGVDVGQSTAVRLQLFAQLWQNIEDISLCCEKSEDDCVVLIHEVIGAMAADNDVTMLSTEEKRSMWKDSFGAKFLKPVLDGEIQNIPPAVCRTLKSKVEAQLNKPDNNMVRYPVLWKYQRPLTLSSLQNLIKSNLKEDCPNLTALLANWDSLKLVHQLPNIVKFLHAVSKRFVGTHTRKSARRTKIGDIDGGFPGLDAFIECWNQMKTISGENMLSEESKLSEFLIDKHKGENQNAVKLLSILVTAHNEVICKRKYSSSSPVPLSEVTDLGLVSVTSKDELLNLVMSYRKVDCEEGRYDWPEIDKQVVIRYLSNKPTIEFIFNQLPFFTFKEDFDLHNKLKAIDHSQTLLGEPLHVVIVKHLEGSIKQLDSKDTNRVQTLTRYLLQLRVVINSLSGMPKIAEEDSLGDNIEKKFGIMPGYLTPDVKLKHVKHIWLLVKYEKAHLLMQNKQEPFDDVAVDCKEVLPQGLEKSLRDRVHLNSIKTKRLLISLFEFITLCLNKEAMEEKQEGAYTKHSLNEVLEEYANSKHARQKSCSNGENPIDAMPQIPEQIKVKHAVKTWKFIWRRYTGNAQ